eukprot:GGOE01036310.1.p1 GENE.GGOE01036310.1~~GGOE01036310.1.p1  ORF type:complete len:110 (+),score=10.24 GGOE01036310.1:55-384(+)
MECDDLCPETQAEKAADREAMLKFWLNVRGTRATFHMYENVVAEAQYECVDGEQSSIFVKNLQTPLGVYPDALLRMSDIRYIEFPKFTVQCPLKVAVPTTSKAVMRSDP